MLIAILLAFILYFAPGLAFLSIFCLPKSQTWTRLFAALVSSFVVLPYFFLVVGSIMPLRPGSLPAGLWLPTGLITAILVVLGLVLRRMGKSIEIKITPATQTVLASERWAVWVFLVIFATAVNLPRLEMFVAGGQTGMIPQWDENWHLAQLVSVARSGIPPQHYYFPEISLAYYYGAWIIPAVLGSSLGSVNLSGLEVPLARAMSLHAWVITFTFLGLFYELLQRLVRQRVARLVGVLIVTLMGGFDLYASLPSIDQVDWWQNQAGWLVSKQQISQWITLYIWTPHHVAAGVLFLAALFVWQYVQVANEQKWLVIGSLCGLAFVFSPFVCIGGGLALLLALTWEWKLLRAAWHQLPKQLIILVLLFSLAALLPAWHSAWIYLQHEGSLTWNDWRIPVTEQLRGSNPSYALLDRLLAILGLPLSMGWVGAIEMGLSFLLYLIWWGRRLLGKNQLFATSLEALLGWQPVVCIFLVVILSDSGGGGNLAMRGMIPAQILISLAAVLVIDDVFPKLSESRTRRWVWEYIFLLFLVGQGLSMAAEWRTNSISLLRYLVAGRPSNLGNPVFGYIHWINTRTPSNSLIIEQGCPSSDPPSYRWLERQRLLSPVCASSMDLFERDRDFTILSEWRAYRADVERAGAQDAWDFPQVALELLKNVDVDNLPIYQVVWHANQPTTLTRPEGALVYEDNHVTIYHLR
jgi:hypothetical protein